MMFLSGKVLEFADSFEDTLEVQYSIVCALAHSSNLSKSIQSSIAVLGKLGIELPDPECPTESETMINLEQTKSMLRGFIDQQLIERESMVDKSKLMAMKFLARLENSSQMLNPVLQPVVTMKMVSLRLQHLLFCLVPFG